MVQLFPVADDDVDDGSADLVERFFGRLLSPKDHFSASLVCETNIWSTYRNRVIWACDLLISESASQGSGDPNLEKILKYVKTAVSDHQTDVAYLFSQLAALAIEKPVADDDESITAQWLRYYGWMAQGRKDETSPFSKISRSGRKPATDVFKAFLTLDASSKRCAECGKQEGITNCSGCLVQHGGRSTFATAYCGKECQFKHWKKHKAFCRQLQQIHRASSVYQEIFEHFILSNYHRTFTEITEKHGMVMVTDSGTQGRVPFPTEVALSAEVGRAALVGSFWNSVFQDASSLLEMLIRPVSAKIQRVKFITKNMERPLWFIATDEQPNRHQFNSLELHEVELVTLSCGVSVVLDPTAAQCGWREALAPFRPYNQQRALKIKFLRDVERYSAGSSFTKAQLDQEKARGGALPTLRDEQTMMDAVVLSLQPQIKAKFGGVENFLQLKGGEFPAARAAVVDAAKRGLSLLADELTKGSRPINVGNSFRSGRSTSNSLESGHEVDFVWCSAVESKLVFTHPGKMRGVYKRWKARWNKAIEIKLPSSTTKSGKA